MENKPKQTETTSSTKSILQSIEGNIAAPAEKHRPTLPEHIKKADEDSTSSKTEITPAGNLHNPPPPPTPMICRRNYKNVQDLEDKIDEYFELGGSVRTVIVGNGSNKQAVELKIYTLTGICLYLGFNCREAFLSAERNPTYTQAIKRARMLIENIYEENLQTTGNSGNIFALKNFGWVDKQEIIHDEKRLKLDI